MFASTYGHTGIVKFLLANGANPLLTDIDDRTAYDLVLQSKHPDLAVALLDDII